MKIQIKADGNSLAETDGKSSADAAGISSDIDAQPQKKQTNAGVILFAAAVAIGGICLCVRSAGARRTLKVWQQNHGGNGKTARP